MEKRSSYYTVNKPWVSPNLASVSVHAAQVAIDEATMASQVLGMIVHTCATARETVQNGQDVKLTTYELLDAEEIAKRACDVAEAMYREYRQRGWMLDLPNVRDTKE